MPFRTAASCGNEFSVESGQDTEESQAKVVLDRAGHRLQMEQEKLFNALVDEWLDRVEESIVSNFYK